METETVLRAYTKNRFRDNRVVASAHTPHTKELRVIIIYKI
jgi:hypothetical protein